ncbi:1238_t:CDS:1, partial [Diversispora eburnea]
QVIDTFYFYTFLHHAIHNTVVLYYDFSQVSFPHEDSNNTSIEVPLDEANGVLSELFEHNNINNLILTKNLEDILPNKFFDNNFFDNNKSFDNNKPLYPIIPEMSFDNWTKFN